MSYLNICLNTVFMFCVVNVFALTPLTPELIDLLNITFVNCFPSKAE